MNKIEINVKNADGSIVGKLDIGKAEINTVFQLVDIREPDKKSGDHTLTFTIPGTKINNQIFQHIYENGFASFAYNPNKKLNAQILVDGNQYFIGYLQMNTATKTDNKLIEYEVTIYGAFVSFFNEMGDTNLRDTIDLSDYNHLYNIKVIKESWDTNIYQYGLKKTFQLGDGYVYPMEYRGQDKIDKHSIELFRPSIYVKTIFDRILKKYGVTYESSFLKSEYFRRLIIPYSGDKNMSLTKDQIDNVNTLVNAPSPPNRPTLLTISSKSGRDYKDMIKIKYPNETSKPASDIGNNYNTTTGIMTIPKNGKYNLVAVNRFELVYTGTKTDGSSASPIKLKGGPMTGIAKIVNATTGVVLQSTSFVFNTPAMNNNNWVNTEYRSETIPVTVSYTGPLTVGAKYIVVLDVFVPGSNFTYQTMDGTTPGYPVSGPMVDTSVKVNLVSTELGTPINNLDAPRFELALLDTNVSEGDNLDMNYFIPDMKSVDFIKEINKLFNLYWKPVGDRKFIIEPKDDFYAQTANIINWTYQVDNAKSMKIEPIYDLNYKEYEFTYSYDPDYYNKDYNGSYNETYGTKTLSVDNDFVTEKIKIQSQFSSTVSVKHLGSKRVLPAYVSQDNAGLMGFYKAKTRILFYGGLIYTTDGKWYFTSPYNNYIVDMNLTKYPYAGHFDNPINPRWDLNWGMTQKYYFPWTELNNNGLYNTFWRNHVEEMLDKDSHLLTAQVILNTADMNNFDIRNTIQVNNVYYRINKITHNPLNDEAEVELIKIKAYKPLTPGFIQGGIGTSTDGTNTPTPTFTSIWNGTTPKNPTTPGGWSWPGSKPSVSVPYKPKEYSGSFFESAQFNPVSNIGDWTTSAGSRWFGSSQKVPQGVFSSTANYDANNNTFSPQTSKSVMGANNYIDPTANSIRISGENNRVMSAASNISIQGNNNVIAPGITNVSVIGDNQNITRSNIAVVNGMIIEDGTIKTNTKLLRGTINSVGSKNGRIKGGKNNVMACTIIRGGQDTSS
jgi:hypothetical protein